MTPLVYPGAANLDTTVSSLNVSMVKQNASVEINFLDAQSFPQTQQVQAQTEVQVALSTGMVQDRAAGIPSNMHASFSQSQLCNSIFQIDDTSHGESNGVALAGQHLEYMRLLPQPHAVIGDSRNSTTLESSSLIPLRLSRQDKSFRATLHATSTASVVSVSDSGSDTSHDSLLYRTTESQAVYLCHLDGCKAVLGDKPDPRTVSKHLSVCHPLRFVPGVPLEWTCPLSKGDGQICGKKLQLHDRNDQARHICTHLKAKQLICQIRDCRESFSAPQAYRDHMKNAHHHVAPARSPLLGQDTRIVNHADKSSDKQDSVVLWGRSRFPRHRHSFESVHHVDGSPSEDIIFDSEFVPGAGKFVQR